MDRLRKIPWWIAPLALYLALTIFVEAFHEPWFDEAQAWLIARDSSVWNLLTHQLRYEGSPGLWHLILMVPAKLGAPYWSIAVISIAFGTLGAWMVLRFAPFPKLFRVAFIFSYFAFYQYAVVARSYCLFLPAIVLLAMYFRSWRQHLWVVVIALIVLANISLHGMFLAAIYGGFLAQDYWRTRHSFSAAERRQVRWAGALLGLVIAVVFVQLIPPADLTGGTAWHLQIGSLFTGIRIWAGMLSWPILSIPIIIFFCYWCKNRGILLLYLIPTVFLLCFFAFKYFSPWHEGILVYIWLFTAWVGWRIAPQKRRHSERPFFALSLIGIAAAQLFWTGDQSIVDIQNTYSAGEPLAMYLKAQPFIGHRIDLVGKWATAALPYFSGNIYYNLNGGHGPSYYLWTSQYPSPPVSCVDLYSDRADYIVVGEKGGQPMNPGFLPGYVEIAGFPGTIYWKGSRYEGEQFFIFQRTPLADNIDASNLETWRCSPL